MEVHILDLKMKFRCNTLNKVIHSKAIKIERLFFNS